MTSPPHASRRDFERIRARLRLALPPTVKYALNGALDAADPLLVRRYRARSGDTRPLPLRALRARSGQPGIRSFLQSGERAADDLEAALRAVDRELSQLERVLEFGCGCARVLGALERRAGAGTALFGCDLDRAAIRWAERHHPALRLAVNGANPPLPFAGSSFDLVYSSSVFTHLDPQDQSAWLEELRRLLGPRGLLMISIYGDAAFSGYRSGRELGVTSDFRRRLRRRPPLEQAGVIFEPYQRSARRSFNFAGGDHPYGITFNGHAHLRRHWSRDLDVVAILPGGWWLTGQDLVVLRSASAADAGLERPPTTAR